MTLNARKSSVDSFLKIKTNDNLARFPRNPQNSENLSEKSRDIVGVHQRAADFLQRL